MARYSQYTTISVTTAIAQLVPQATNRVGLTIGCPLTSNVSVSTEGNAGFVSGSGINLMPNTPPWEISLEKHGDLVQKKLYVIGAAAVTIGIVETFEL